MTMPVNDRLARIALEALLIFVIGVLVGLSINYQLVLDAFAGRLVPPAETGVAEPSRPAQPVPAPIDLEGVRQMLQEQGALAVDARIPELYAAGHLPEAVSLPLERVEDELASFARTVSETRPLITYCSGYGCPDSYDLAVRLLEQGYREVYVFEGGMPAWEAAGLPVAREEARP